jgi:hypothetical protein
VADLATLDQVFRRVEAWPGVEVEFAPEPSGKGPKIHCMVREPGGIRLEFACLPVSQAIGRHGRELARDTQNSVALVK